MVPEGVSVTLVEPKYPVNVGHVARLLKNFRVKKLYLVKPTFDMSVAAVYASHAAEVLDEAEVATFDRVRSENDLLVATTAVRATSSSNAARRMVPLERLRELLGSAKSSSIVFGRESTGLTNAEIELCDATTTIDTAKEYRALNIGHAVAIVLYLASRRAGSKGKRQTRTAREVFARSLFELGGAARYPERKVDGLFLAGKRMAAESKLTDEQLHLLTGVLRRATATIADLQDADSKT